MSEQFKRLQTIYELAEAKNLKVSWIRSKVFQRQIPFIKLGRLLRFDPDDIESWLESKKEKQS